MMQNPKYTKGTISTNLYEFTNREQDLIKQAFSPVNYTYMSKLPHKISPSKVSESIKNTTLDRINKRYMSVPKANNEFPWFPDSYDLSKLQRNKETQDSLKKQMRISPQQFKPPGIHKKLKYEELAGDTFKYFEDSFNSVSDQTNRVKWIRSTQYISKEFKSPQKNDYKVGRNRIREVIKLISKNIRNDWENLLFSVDFTVQELIEIKFSMSALDNRKALHRYMNMMQENDMYVQEFSLKKVMEKWGVLIDGFLFYALSPPWVHMRTSNPSIRLFPHGSSISMSRTGKNMPGSESSLLYGLGSTSP